MDARNSPQGGRSEETSMPLHVEYSLRRTAAPCACAHHLRGAAVTFAAKVLR